MVEIFVIADTHLGHKRVLEFTRDDGTPLRPFKSLEEMHTTIAERWNSVVTSRDKVYHLGDVAFTRSALGLIGMLNGKKRLVRGNHDLFPTRLYLDYFDEVYGVRKIDGVWMTHVPMHWGSVAQSRVTVNIHGHLHEKVIRRPKYFNACVERIGYTPVSIDEVLTKC